MNNYKICIIGLGNVGLDLALNFSKHYQTIGYDINKKLVEKIKVEKKKYLKGSEAPKNKLMVSNNHKLIINCDIYIITVPTPINKEKKPDLHSIIEATKLISKFLSKSNIVIYESTFYPGMTEEVCIPLIEKISKLKLNKDFFVGYSPERINIGKNRKLSNDIIKITSGSNKIATKLVDNLYKTVIQSGTHCVENIKIAEAAKMLENCQRDLNIALMNELTKFFKEINIDINKVIEAAASKWNFSKFYPGLVGGDCIAVDPYYIIHAAKKISCDLPLIELARETNEGMLNYVYNSITKKLSNKNVNRLAFFGISYKENCGQINNSIYLKLAERLSNEYDVDMYDYEVEKKNSLNCICRFKDFHKLKYDAIIIGSKHKKYENIDFKKITKKSTCIVDLHGFNIFSDEAIF